MPKQKQRRPRTQRGLRGGRILGRVRLHHVDYDCGGLVLLKPNIGLRCAKCGLSSATGPLSVISE